MEGRQGSTSTWVGAWLIQQATRTSMQRQQTGRFHTGQPPKLHPPAAAVAPSAYQQGLFRLMQRDLQGSSGLKGVNNGVDWGAWGKGGAAGGFTWDPCIPRPDCSAIPFTLSLALPAVLMEMRNICNHPLIRWGAVTQQQPHYKQQCGTGCVCASSSLNSRFRLSTLLPAAACTQRVLSCPCRRTHCLPR